MWIEDGGEAVVIDRDRQRARGEPWKGLLSWVRRAEIPLVNNVGFDCWPGNGKVAGALRPDHPWM